MNVSHRPRAVVLDVIGMLFSLESQRPRLMACGLPESALEAWFAASLRVLFALGVTGPDRADDQGAEGQPGPSAFKKSPPLGRLTH